MPAYRVEKITKRFGGLTALDGVTLDVRAGELLVLLGPTGAGKTTLLRMLAGLERLSDGKVMEDGREITHFSPAQRDMAMVFQNFSLYPRLSVFDNLAFGLRPAWRGVSDEEIGRRVRWAAELLGLTTKLGSRPTELSGGQQQRVALGRAIVREPKLFLFDEPLASLDAKLREAMIIELHRLQRRLKVTMIYVTHDQNEAMALADRIAVIDGGRILQVGTPAEIYSEPLTPRVAQLLGSPLINLLTRPEIRAFFPEGALDPLSAVFGIRPEHVQASASVDGAIIVRVIEHLGPVTLVHATATLEGKECDIRVTLPPGNELRVGDRLRLGVSAEKVLRWQV